MVTTKQRVRVYYNIRRRCLSIMDKKTRRVIGYANYVHLRDAKFIVSAAGLKRIRRERRKSVIAFVEGDYMTGHMAWDSTWKRVYFNPYKVDQFVVIGEGPIEEADHVCIAGKNIYAKEALCEIC